MLRRFAGACLFLTGLLAFSAAGYAAAPAAGTTIGNQASADYTDSSGTPRTATSNVVQTVVQPVYSHTLLTDRTATAAPGGQVTYPHTLTNTGNATDSYTLGTAQVTSGDNFDYGTITIYADADQNGVADNATPLTGSISLNAGQSFGYVIVATIPGAATSGQTAALTTTATSANSGTQTNTDTVTVTNNAVITVTKAVSSGSGPSPSAAPLTYTLSYTNTGNTAGTALTITDVIPAGMTYVAGSARWSITGATALTDAADGAQGAGPTITYDFGITVANRVTAVISVVNPNETRTLTFQVNVNSAVTPGVVNNTANYSYDPDGAGGTPATSPAPTNTVPYTVTQTAAVEFGNISSNGNFQDEIVSPDGIIASATPGATIAWNGLATTVKNFGNGADSFDITVVSNNFPAGTSFALYKSDGVTPLIDTNGNSTPDTGNLAAGATYAVVVKATLPAGATGSGPFTVLLRATSFVDNTKRNTVTNQLTALGALTVDLTNNLPASDAGTQPGEGAGPEASPVITNTTAPGITTRFTLVAYNPNLSADSFDLAASTVANFSSISLPAGWTVVFRNTANAVITTTGTIPALSNFTYYADVTAPAGTAPGTTDLYFRIMSPATSVKDTLHDAVTISTVRNLVVTPNNTGQGAPGSTVVYEHAITNNGNVIEGNGVGSNVALGLADTLAGWTSLVYYDANNNGSLDGTDPVVSDLNFVSNGAAGLAPLESVRIFVKVTVPGSAASPQSNVTTLSATTTNVGYATTVPAVASATDSTNVVQGNLQLVKTQALDANCDGVADTAFASTQITTGAIPGACVMYRIVVTNIGTLTATSVKVYDATPNATTYEVASSVASVTGGTTNTVDVVPTDEAAGSFTFNVGDLAPGATATITFGVQIDQ